MFFTDGELARLASEVKVPIAILGAEMDHLSPAEQLKQFGEMLSSKSEVGGSQIRGFFFPPKFSVLQTN